MADIELVIKIDEDQYEFIKQSLMIKDVRDYRYLLWDICEDIKNGTPLPKGHGRMMILSEDAVRREQCIVSFSCQKWISAVGLSKATVAVIEADMAESEEQADVDDRL